MNPLEEFLRLAFTHDFGKTPEQFLETLSWSMRKERVLGLTTDCSNQDIQSSLFEMTAVEMLDKYQEDILTAARKNNIDGRAIAGAIAWEYEINWKGRMSDRWQIHLQGEDMGIGWGSIHSNPAKAIRPGVPDQELVCMRVNAQSALVMVADIMGRNATQYFQISGGIWINENPPILAYFFNTGPAKVEESAKKRRLESIQSGQVVTLDVDVNPMAKWVKQHLSRFQDFQTTVKPPSAPHVKAQAG